MVSTRTKSRPHRATTPRAAPYLSRGSRGKSLRSPFHKSWISKDDSRNPSRKNEMVWTRRRATSVSAKLGMPAKRFIGRSSRTGSGGAFDRRYQTIDENGRRKGKAGRRQIGRA